MALHFLRVFLASASGHEVYFHLEGALEMEWDAVGCDVLLPNGSVRIKDA